ncbi:MAG: hypothetical protein R2867_44210 [Caldilineaceae bacterium]
MSSIQNGEWFSGAPALQKGKGRLRASCLLLLSTLLFMVVRVPQAQAMPRATATFDSAPGLPMTAANVAAFLTR